MCGTDAGLAPPPLITKMAKQMAFKNNNLYLHDSVNLMKYQYGF